MPNLPLQFATFVVDLVVILIAVYFVAKLSSREKQVEQRERELAKKEGKIDIDYHQIVDNALTKERKILEDAVNEAKQIIADAQYVSQNSKETIDKALLEMAANVQKEAGNIGMQSIVDYKNYLGNLSSTSLGNFQNIAKEFGTNLEKQVKEFRETLLPNLEKEIEDYKREHLKKIDKAVEDIVQKVAQKALNKSIPSEDHNNLIIASLEKAKKEGIFD
jgi:F0F1-type ATP synthase membrane subunit b/b'